MKIHNWTNVSLEEFCSWFISADSLKKHFQKYELSRCISAISTKLERQNIKFNMKWQKYRIVDFPTQITRDGMSLVTGSNVKNKDLNVRTKKSKIRHTQTLRKLCFAAVTKLSKTYLSTIMAQHTWERAFKDWQNAGPIPNFIDISGVKKSIQWFTQPSIGADEKIRFHYTDASHILTCIRTKLCTTGIAGLNIKAWEEAALSPDANLNISVVECVDKQDFGQTNVRGRR